MPCRAAFPGILSLAILILTAIKASDALNCYVCNSVNGSQPECERGGANGELPDSLLEKNCRSMIGSMDGHTPLKATACMVLMGEYRDKITNKVNYVVSRKCTGGIQPWAEAKNINCQLFDSEGHLPSGGERQYITGCAEACFEDQCNGKPWGNLTERFRPKMKEYIESAQRADPKSRIRFPSIFAVEETKRLISGNSEASTSSAKSFEALVGAVVFAILLVL